jgi:hypothetical protein
MSHYFLACYSIERLFLAIAGLLECAVYGHKLFLAIEWALNAPVAVTSRPGPDDPKLAPAE